MRKFFVVLIALYSHFSFSYTPNPCKAVEKKDLDGDGQINKSEWVADKGSSKGFKSFDLDSDGFITPTEWAKLWKKQGKEFKVRGCQISLDDVIDLDTRIKKRDLNSDGILTIEEYSGEEDLFKTTDLNGNGEINSWELGALLTYKGEKVKTNDESFNKTLVTINEFNNARFLQALPKGDGPFPVVILSSGGSGYPKASWGEYLKDWGYAVIAIDHRGTHKEAFSKDTYIGASQRVSELPKIVEYIKSKNEFISEDISILGFSLGSAAVFKSGNYGIKKGVALYPYGSGCGTISAPPEKLLFIFGTLDPVYSLCWSGSESRNYGEVFEIEGTYHAFDNPYRKGTHNYGRFTEISEWSPDAFKKSREKVKRFLED